MSADWLTASGLGAVKPFLAALALPPVPFIALALAGAWLTRRRPRTGRWMVLLACIGLWFSACTGAARMIEEAFLQEPSPLDAPGRAQLKARAAAGESLAIVVLGGGMSQAAHEYGTPTLASDTLARLKYGVWLGRQTGIPVAASGGLGWANSAADGPAEATQMAAIAQAEFGSPLRWVEPSSRDTHENAVNTLALLKPAGVREIILVTHGAHMPRALREFQAAAAGAAPPIRITPAAMGQAWPAAAPALQWMPSGEGAQRMQGVLHELIASIASRG